MTAANRTGPRASGGVLFRLWLARLRIRRGAGAAPDRAPAGLGREDAEAVIGACTMTRGAAFGPPFSCGTITELCSVIQTPPHLCWITCQLEACYFTDWACGTRG